MPGTWLKGRLAAALGATWSRVSAVGKVSLTAAMWVTEPNLARSPFAVGRTG
jgi:hypothetical protein